MQSCRLEPKSFFFSNANIIWHFQNSAFNYNFKMMINVAFLPAWRECGGWNVKRATSCNVACILPWQVTASKGFFEKAVFMCHPKKLCSVQKSDVSVIHAEVSWRFSTSQQWAASLKLEEKLLICTLPSQSRLIRAGKVPPQKREPPSRLPACSLKPGALL